jgi:hypothetical protein
LPVRPSGRCKHLTGTREVYFYSVGEGGLTCELNLTGNQSLTGCVRATNVEVTIGRGGLHTGQSNVELGYQLSICSGTKENHGKP